MEENNKQAKLIYEGEFTNKMEIREYPDFVKFCGYRGQFINVVVDIKKDDLQSLIDWLSLVKSRNLGVLPW